MAVLAAAVLLLGASAAGAEPEPPSPWAPPHDLVLTAHRFERAPSLDGALDEWKDVGAASRARLERLDQTHPNRRAGWEGPEDASAEVTVGVHGDDLLLAVRVTDDCLLHDPQRAWWHGDSLELFVNADLPSQGTPPHAFTEGCWQIFLMPANPELPWGVVYRGPRLHFSDAGLRGVLVAPGPPRSDGQDYEVRIPLENFGVTSRDATRLGFALALNDSDEAPEQPGTYLSWNQGFDLYLHPDHFGVLELPARTTAAAPPPASAGLGPWWPLLAVLLAAAAALAMAGPGARMLTRVGPRPKAIGLALVALLALGVYLEGDLSQRAAHAETTRDLQALAREAERIAGEARAAGALFEPEAGQRGTALAQLLAGRRIPCRPGCEDAALVALHPGGRFAAAGVPAYGLDLRQPREFLLPAPVTTDAFRLRLDPSFRAQDPGRPTALGRLTFAAEDGRTQAVAVVAPPATAASAGWSVALSLEAPAPWRRLTWDPDPSAPPATLRGIDAVGAAGALERLLLTGRTDEGIPVLAHPAGPDQGVDVAPGAAVQVALPSLPGADRLWLLLEPERAFPRLLGDQVLARVTWTYEVGEAPAPLALRNGEHLVAQRMLPGIRASGLHGREAFRWRDAMGYTHVQQALPLELDRQRPARTLTIENTGAGGSLRVVAATLVRTRRGPAGGRVQVVTDAGTEDGLLLLPTADGPRFEDHLGAPPVGAPAGQARVTVRRTIGAGEDAVPLSLGAALPDGLAGRSERTRIALLACLALVLFLAVLLVVDVTGRLRQLSFRLGAGVLAAALVPLGVTIVLVERENTTRIEAQHADRARGAVQQILVRLDAAQVRVQEAASQLARYLATERDPGQTAEIHRLVGLYGAAALSPGLVGSVSVSGALLPPLHLPLGDAAVPSGGGETAAHAPWNPRRGLASPRYLDGDTEGPGMRASPWDGLMLVGTSRSGTSEDWVRVAIGVRVEDAFLRDAVREALGDDPAVGLVLDDLGHALTRAGRTNEAFRRSLAPQLPALEDGGAVAGTHVLRQLDAEGASFLGVAAPLGEGRAARPGAVWLALGLDRAGIDRAVADQRLPLLWLALFGVVLIVGVAGLVARRVADPVRDLVAVTDAVRQGRFDVEVPGAGSDEVGRLALAFDQMRLDLKQRVEDLGCLREAQEELARSLEYATRAHGVTDLFASRFGADEAILLDVRGDHGPATVVAARGEPDRFAERTFELPPGGRLGSAAASRVPVDVETVGGAGAPSAEGPMGARILARCPSWVAVPLRSGAEAHGLLLLGWKDVAAVPRGETRRLMEPLAGIAAAALNNARLYRLAALDDVTRLPGATAFEAALRADVERAVAGGPPAVLLRIRLDHLEHVGLRRGVELSRRLLRGCANALLAVVGERVRLGRLRGEQLAVRLPGATPDEARALAERVRERLRAVEVHPPARGESAATTVSIGIARCPGDARSLEFLLDAADRAMAAAQSEGGDRVEDAARLASGAVDTPPFEEGAIFRNQAMVRIVESARRAARSDASVLITGETGTGKEVIAQLIHRRSGRANRPFVTVNCAAFPETLLESELFGHERGAFTGAERRREGRFELADGGTLFLDEVAEMTPAAQVKLLRVLQERQFTRLGGTRPVTVDVRILAATNQDLEQAVAKGRFREDLYYRLNVIRLEIPPLRERREEIPPLVDLFLREAARRGGVAPRRLTSAAMDVLYRHPWPGNVRELKNVIERCAVLCEAESVAPEDLQLDVAPAEGAPFLAPQSAPRDDLSARQRKLLAYLARHGRCTNREYYEMAETSPRTGLRDLQDLMSRGLLVREGRRRGAVYRLP